MKELTFYEAVYGTEKMRMLCYFQYWLAENYSDLPTNSVEMTKRASLFAYHYDKLLRERE